MHVNGSSIYSSVCTVVAVLTCLAILAPTLLAQRTLSSCQCKPVDLPAKGFYNPAQLAIDTCGLNVYPSDCNAALWKDASHWDERTYAFNAWVVEFQTPALWLPWAPFDSEVDTTWAAIDTLMHPTLRAAFVSLEKRFGHYVFQKIDPADTGLWRYRLIFDSYCPRDSVLNILSKIDSVSAEFGPGFSQDASEVPPAISSPASPRFAVYPNPAKSIMEIDLQKQSPAKGKVLFVNAMGQIVATTTLTGGESDLSYRCAEFPAGVYCLVIGSMRSQVVIVK